jgi:parallel beta-helix repeat protein
VFVTLLLALALPTGAQGHIERSSYWPDPAADTSVTPPAGGRVPTARSLASTLTNLTPAQLRCYRKHLGKRARRRCAAQARRQRQRRGQPPGEMLSPGVRVVCQSDSLARATQAIADAQTKGFRVRPTAPLERLTAAQARDLLERNQDFFALCRYHEIQPAVTASSNNGRVVIMPGLYTEPTARRAATHDNACSKYVIANDRGNGGALSYTYQTRCPNDQNLIAVMGRAPGAGKDPQPPLEDRHGIPNRGPCIRCNFQIEGSGPSADDVIIDAGRVESANHGPIGSVKDVGIRADRADGFVLRNMTVRHAGEHDIYVLESNGYLLDHFKTFYGGEYGVLTFVEDHGLMQNCEAAGNGDSGLYPGAGANTGTNRAPGTAFRYSQELRYCDSHHNTGGYSGTDGDATHIDHNNFYDNSLGFTTDVFTSPGHPGFPQNSDLIENNNFYSNNYNPYLPGADIRPSIPVPVGTGLWIAGGNDNIIRNNHFYDNWRRGIMIFSAPDAFICGPAPAGTPVTGCDPAKVSTSYNNRIYGNTMGVTPTGTVAPNGLDFWWDSYPANTGNCWYQNSAAPAKAITSSPDPLPNCSNGADPSSSVGNGVPPTNEGELAACLIGVEAGRDTSLPGCNWYTTPAKPGG